MPVLSDGHVCKSAVAPSTRDAAGRLSEKGARRGRER